MKTYRLYVTDLDGQTHQFEAPEGWRVMEVIRDYGLPIKAECGGACACATCHIYVHEDWNEQLIPPSDEELERLDEAMMVEDNSRLSCQILMSDALDGLAISLAPNPE